MSKAELKGYSVGIVLTPSGFSEPQLAHARDAIKFISKACGGPPTLAVAQVWRRPEVERMAALMKPLCRPKPGVSLEWAPIPRWELEPLFKWLGGYDEVWCCPCMGTGGSRQRPHKIYDMAQANHLMAPRFKLVQPWSIE